MGIPENIKTRIKKLIFEKEIGKPKKININLVDKYEKNHIQYFPTDKQIQFKIFCILEEINKVKIKSIFLFLVK